jgi:hypothetical protein
VNTIFSGRITHGEVICDYSGVWTRRSAGIDWKAIVRSSDVLCKPSGILDEELTDAQVREVIRELVRIEVEDRLRKPARRE